jgi:hypothetical protein
MPQARSAITTTKTTPVAMSVLEPAPFTRRWVDSFGRSRRPFGVFSA